ncbi:MULTISPECIES: sulfotransferase domain-containing protein [unclassified Leptolyngbya]|uniref:sulfotransferase domain-containing protein n=1 Tax=unclassified Leptolyngbya TaxID=2650499 RepID=UPI001687A73D|nr:MULTISPECIES: sulfotransferase domain-containing protein [unclassified Leptolyngbya]MBD1909214.1 sulfotransferase domain-containing protein [Leptolyngbya sp. FACHB-8]MBD2153983.1 sulfotransferase domain-containing protein [Leptolyngbya sp. FACHB-16]
MWVFCGGMFRSASTLQFQITTRLVKDAGVGEQIGWIDAYRFAEIQRTHTHKPGFKVVKVHVCTESIQAEFLQDNALGIYIFRDVRDVFSSYLKQRQKSFQFIWNEGFLETCLNNYKIWTTLPNTLVSTYQRVMDNPPEEVLRIAHHLNLDINLEECQQIADDYSLESQQQRIECFRKQLLQTPLNPNDHREIVDYHDEETLLHMNHIDSAKRGRWREDLLPEEVALIEEKVIEWCNQHSYNPSLFLQKSNALLSTSVEL